MEAGVQGNEEKTYHKRCKEFSDPLDLSSILVNQSFHNHDTRDRYPYPTFAFAVRTRERRKLAIYHGT